MSFPNCYNTKHMTPRTVRKFGLVKQYICISYSGKAALKVTDDGIEMRAVHVNTLPGTNK